MTAGARGGRCAVTQGFPLTGWFISAWSVIYFGRSCAAAGPVLAFAVMRLAVAVTLLWCLGCSRERECAKAREGAIAKAQAGLITMARAERAAVWEACHDEAALSRVDAAIAEADQALVRAATSAAAVGPVPPSKPTGCLLSVPRKDRLGPLVFPEREGLVEFDNAIMARASGADLVVIANAAGAYNVGWRTRCSYIEEGFSHSKVRLLDGPHAGDVAWVATTQTRGD